MRESEKKLKESYESVINKFDDLDRGFDRTENLIKGLYIVVLLTMAVTVMLR